MLTSVPSGLTPTGFARSHDTRVGRIGWSPDGSSLAVSKAAELMIWQLQPDLEHERFSPPAEATIWDFSWAPDGQGLAVAHGNEISMIGRDGEEQIRLIEHRARVYAVQWSPDGRFLATASADHTICIWDAFGNLVRQLNLHQGSVYAVAWSPDGSQLATASKDRTVELWDTSTWKPRALLQGHTGWVTSVVWSHDSRTLISASVDATIRVWDAKLGRAYTTLEGHTDGVYSLSISHDDSLLVSTSADRTIRFWDGRSDWRQLTSMPQPPAHYGYYWPAGAVFDPSRDRVAMLHGSDRIVTVWDVTGDVLRQSASAVTIQQSTAKVVLLGDSGVGKSGLARVLAGESFAETESTHGRSIRTLFTHFARSPEGTISVQEVLLWDLAGQPGYRILHSLNLNQIDVAVVVFDPMLNAADSIRYWTRMARQGAEQTPVILVGARVDRSTFTQLHQLSNALFVNARTGEGIAQLRAAIESEIRWDTVPKISSTALLQRIKSFVLSEKESGRQLSTVDQLHRVFLGQRDSAEENIRAEFDTAIRLLASTGLIEVLSVGEIVLLQPELLDQYRVAILQAVRTEAEGLGTIRVDDLLAGRIPISSDVKIREPQLERTLLSATMEELLRREIALLEGTGDTAFLLFPTETRRVLPETIDAPRPEITYRFTGPVSEIYASLVVRLQYTEAFRRTAIWQNASEYAAPGGGTCRLNVRELNDGQGELQLSFSNVGGEARASFIEYVRSTLEKRAARGSVQRSRTVICPTCGTEIGEHQVAARLERGLNYIVCPVCETRISLVESDESVAAESTPAFERSADMGRDRSEAAALLQGKLAAGDFDVYVSYPYAERVAVADIARRLRQLGILPWLMEEQVAIGQQWTRAMAEQVAKAKAFAVFVGKHGVGDSQREEIAMLMDEAQRRRVALIPVLLPDLEDESVVPLVLRSYTWVDFRQSYPDPLELLARGIMGSRGSMPSSSRDEPAKSAADLQRALDAAESARDWPAARQLLMDVAHAARERGVAWSPWAERALKMADDPAKLDGRGLREPLEMLIDLPAVIEAWVPSHREAALRELRDLGSARPEVFDLLRRTGIERWTKWFAAPDASTIATLPRSGQGWPAVRVRRLRLRDIKSFSNASFDFTKSDGVPELVTTFVGDNATGKSTMLQCIALACLGSKFAGKLEAISAQTLLRSGQSSGAIEVELDLTIDPSATPAERGTVCLGLALDNTRKDLYPLAADEMTFGNVNHMAAWDMLREQVGLQWGYCGGYGAFRALRERRDTLTTSGQTPIEIDRALSLFQPQATLLEPAVFESILQADISALSSEPRYIPLGVRDVIAAAVEKTIPGVEAREVNGRWRVVESDSGVSSLTALSDGCNSMIGLLGHLIRHTLELRGWIKDPTAAEGIVLIDEIDLHLHPSWQRDALPQLTAVFPNLQFIVTTHSPIVLGGVPDALTGVLTRTEEGMTTIEVGPAVKGWRVDQLLSGAHFDVGTLYDRETEELRTEYGRKLVEFGPEHPVVQALEARLKEQMREPLSNMNPDRDLAELLREFVVYRLGKLSVEEREQTFVRMWELLRQ